jgi:succinate-semialdehyde dehydrogenase/glutarate-semialdehyde dehydrogenase
MSTSSYPQIEMMLGGKIVSTQHRDSITVLNPVNGEEIGRVPNGNADDLALAVASADAAFNSWKARSPLERSAILRKFADLLRANEASIARNITLEEGKPLAEATVEVRVSAEVAEWAAEEGRRTYGRIIPARTAGVQQLVTHEPVGVVLALSPWNFPLSQAVRKVTPALAAGCTVILKGPAETPAGIMAIGHYLREAGLPDGCLNIVWGDPAFISETLIAAPEVKKVSFTGSVPVGKLLASLAGKHMKKTTMELGGHAPVLVFDDVDADAAAKALTAFKLRNAGQVCISPTRFYVQDGVFDRFTEAMVTNFEKTVVGDGLDPATKMGPLAHANRIVAMERLVADAQTNGATIHTGGKRIGNQGYFYAPTVVETPEDKIALMREEPFGPVAIVSKFTETDEALKRANGLPFGLASYVFTNSLQRADHAAKHLKAGMVSINHFGLAVAETPFGGVEDSGYGSEGGIEGLAGYLNTKFVTQMATAPTS